MVPVLLKLSNFTSYGEKPPELDFTKFHMSAISGQNGAGKSSLLDAVTWCLWGSSRAGDSADALIRLGQTQMYVEFSFDLDGHIFTVKRMRSKKSGGHTSLEFWSNSHNLTEGTIKSTQQKIIDTLHLTYETFTNSAFIRQGHADEFTLKGPTDRKRILADILGLDHYDKLEEKAKDGTRDAQTKLSSIEYQLIEIEAELGFKEEREKNYTKLQEDVENANKELKEVEGILKDIEGEKATLQAMVNSLLEKKQRLEDLQKEVVELKTQIDSKEQAQKEYAQIIAKKDLIETNYKKFQGLNEEKQKLEAKRTELIKVKNELVEIQKTLKEREEKRNKAISLLEIEVKEYQTKSEQLEIQNKRLKETKDICPTCGAQMGAEKNRQLLEKNQLEVDDLRLKNKGLEEKIKKYQAIVLPEEKLAKEKEKGVVRLEEETKEYQRIQSQIEELARYEQGYIKLQQAEVAAKTHQEALADLKKIFDSKQSEFQKNQNFQLDLDKYEGKLKEVEQQIAAKLLVKQERSQALLELTGKIGEAKQLINRTTQLENYYKQKVEEKNKLNKEKEVYEELALAFGKRGIQAMIIEAAIPELEDEANRLLEKLTEGRMKVKLETQKETKTKVQTSEGKMRTTVETLDIIISDEMGERSYELYSGGEMFRVNFAIRLAISKLLSHRAGAKLQFLVIDEGFGTQDAAGRARLVEVLDAIKNDFEKIVIITHLEELKEEFPTRIEVSKNTAGSTFEVVGV